MDKPRNIFEAINQNVCNLNENMMAKFEELSAKVDLVYDALYPCEDTEEEEELEEV